MKAIELVGKLALRTDCTSMGDYSYTSEPVKILKVTDSHIYFQEPKGRVRILNNTWLDDNWCECWDKTIESEVTE